MKTKTVYFFFVLTLLSLGLICMPSVHSQTQNIKVIDYSYYIDQTGTLDVVGEVQNIGSNTIDRVFLAGTVYSAGGVDQSDSYTQVWALYLAPEQKAPFYMPFPSPNNSFGGNWNSVQISNLEFAVYGANATSSYQYPDLTIISDSGSIGKSGNYKGVYLVSGVIQNTGSQTATNLTVVGTFYNSTGEVVAVGNTYENLGGYLTSTLAPLGKVSFQVPAFDLNQSLVPSSEKIYRYDLLVQAQGPLLQGTPPTVTSSPKSSSSPTQTETPKSNTSSNTSTIYAIAIVLVILAIVATIIALSRRKPPETAKVT